MIGRRLIYTPLDSLVSMPYCSECGAEIQIGQNYCHECGFNPHSKDIGIDSLFGPGPKTEPEKTQASLYAETTTGHTTLTISSVALIFGLFSPWGWYDSGLVALRYSFSDLAWLLTDGYSFWFSDLGMGPLGYISWLMDILLPLVFVTTFVATWYKSLRGDENFGRKARLFHLSFFVVLWIISSWHFGDVWLPYGEDFGTWIAAASGIGLHSMGRNSGRTPYV